MDITVMGAGHVGLVVGACLADFGLNVTCVDKNTRLVEQLQRGELPFYEPGLQDYTQKNFRAGRLCFSIDMEEAIRRSRVIFIAVGTGSRPDGSVELNAVYEAAEQIAQVMDEYKVVVIKSTVPVGTAALLQRFILEKQAHPQPFDVVSNPEFLREGSAIETFIKPDRVVIGTTSETALAVMRSIYCPLYLFETPMITTTNETAELIKYTANAFLAMKISFINEVANLSDALNCNVHTVAKALGLDRRIGNKFLHPGPGYGGSCFPKDTHAFLRMSKECGVNMNILDAVIRTNDQQPSQVVAKVRKHLTPLKNRTIAILGLSYKSNTDDVRESPAIDVCKLLLKEGAQLRVHDPVAVENARRVLPSEGVEFLTDPYQALRGAECLIILTEWNEFRNLDLMKMKSLLSGNLLFDMRNIYDPLLAQHSGFVYEGMGLRPPIDGKYRTAPSNRWR